MSEDIQDSTNMWDAVNKLTNFREPERSKVYVLSVDEENKTTNQAEIYKLFANEYIIQPNPMHTLGSIQDKI